MKRLRQYSSLFLSSLLAVVFFTLPTVAFAGGAEEFFQEILWSILATITGTILWICALLFDFSVNTFVIGFGDLFLNSGVGVAVDKVWFMLRDFVNMFFIFGLIYIGFRMILDADNSNTRRWMVNLIIAAILINFSLFITKAVVDFSNQLATQIAISGFGGKQVDTDWGKTYEVDLADYTLGITGIKDLLNLNLTERGAGGWGYIFGSAIFFLIMAFVLAAGAFMLMIRFIALTLFILVSPLMFMSWILPPLSDTMQKYWKLFIGRAFFAPIYFLFLYFSLETLNGLEEAIGISGDGSKWAQTLSTANDPNKTVAAAESTLPFFFIMCGFMIASLMIAKKLGADGADKAISLGHSLKNKAGRFTKQQTAGRLARGAGALASSAEGRLNRRLGAMAQGGAASRAAARFIDRTAGAGLRNTQNASVAGSESFNARNTRVGQQNARLNQQQREDVRADTVENNHDTLTNPANPGYGDPTTEAGRAARRTTNSQQGGQIGRMSNEELLAMVRANPALLRSPDFVRHLTDGHMTAIRDSGMVNNDEHRDIGNLRNNAVIDDATAAFEATDASATELTETFRELGQTIRNMSPERKADLGAARLTNQNVAAHLTDQDIEQLERSGRFTATEIASIRTARTNAQTSIANGSTRIGGSSTAVDPVTGVGAQDGFLRQQRTNMMSNSQQAGQLPAEVFAQRDMMEHVTPQALEQRIRNGLTDQEANNIRRELEVYISGLPTGDPARRVWEDWDNRSVNAGRIDLDDRIW